MLNCYNPFREAEGQEDKEQGAGIQIEKFLLNQPCPMPYAPCPISK
ncbi:hypothetical protein FDUTEX481_03056 [Tolypothrix sp. PCC 7601]|nr:hypothetical protein FDUTEX481_03056 [Tolypothrix sp. PCC 7601]